MDRVHSRVPRQLQALEQVARVAVVDAAEDEEVPPPAARHGGHRRVGTGGGLPGQPRLLP
jgi:hypothetical protein